MLSFNQLDNQKGVVHLVLIVTVLGILATFLILNTFSFNSKTFSRLFVRDKSFASQPISGPIVTPSPIPLLTNLVKNPGCETTIRGWDSWHGISSRVTTAYHSGIASCQAALATADNIYTLDDNGQTVSNTQAGQVFTASAWVRSDTAVGKMAGLSLRQWKGSKVYKNTGSTRFTLTNNWQQLTNQVTIDPGVTGLDIYFTQYNAISGESFQADDIDLRLISSP